MTDPAPRSGQFYFSRSVELAVFETLKLADCGLLHRVWTDMRWNATTKVIRGRSIRIEVGEALISVRQYNRENGASRNTLSEALVRISDAGWITCQKLDEGFLVRCLVTPTDEEGAAQILSQGRLKNRARGGSNSEPGVAQKLSHTVNRTQVLDPRLPISGPKAAVSRGALRPTPKHGPPDSRPLDPERDVHPALRAVAGRVGVGLGNVAELLMRGHDEARVLSRLLQMAARAQGLPAKPDRWLRDKCNRGPCDDHIPEAKRLLGLTRTLPGLDFLEGQLPQAGPETAGDVLKRALRKEA